jgi:hypothetical protein
MDAMLSMSFGTAMVPPGSRTVVISPRGIRSDPRRQKNR